MELQSMQDAVLNWASGAARFDRMEFLKDYLKTLTDDELKNVKTLCTHRKRSYRRLEEASVPEDSVTSTDDSASAPSKKPKRFWWEHWKKEDRVGLDVEMVTPIKLEPGQKKFRNVAAEIAVTDFCGHVIFKKKIKHAKGSFKVNRFTKKINGYSEDSLADGEDLEKVVDELLEVLKGKLVITCGGEADFRSFGLSSTQFDHFDIQWYWFEKTINSEGIEVEQTISLRSIIYYYYKQDIQKNIHDPGTDAAATIKLFEEQYIPMCQEKGITEKVNPEPFVNFPRYK